MTWKSLTEGGRLLPVLLALAALFSPAVGQEIDQLKTCLECHDLSEALGAKVSHAPVASGDCTSCHNPHVSRFDGLLLERPGPLCGECHAEVSAELERSVVHAPVAEGRCVDCHTPHGGEHSGLLLRSSAELCVECHEPVTEWRAKPVQHPPFADGDCATCHEPHASDQDGLVVGDGTNVCSACHESDLAFRSAHKGYPVDQAECQQCHDPHAAAQPGLFRSRLHAPFEDGDCTACHAFPGSDDPFRLKQPQWQLCGECHEEQVSGSIEAAFPHISAGGGGCVNCHNAHTADGDGLLLAVPETLCLECHDPGGSKSGEEGRFVSHGDVGCPTCHASHGGPEPFLLVSPSIELCGDCHSHQHSVAHPMGEDSVDPRTGQPMDCLTCHAMHDAPYPKYMHRSGDRELCLGCHKEIGGTGR